MSYTPNNTFGDIPLTGVLIPGITEGYVTESKYVKNGYIVVKTIEERDALLDTTIYEDKDILSIGCPVFVSDENKTYRYVGQDNGPDIWVEDTIQTTLDTATNNISNLQQIVLDINTQLQTKAEINTVANLQSQIDDQATQITTLNDQITALNENKVSLEYFTEITANKENTEDVANTVANLQSQIDASQAQLNNYYTKEEIDSQNELNLIWDYPSHVVQYEVGGIPQGFDLHNMSLKQILYQMLIRAEAPQITEPSISNIVVSNTVGIASQPFTINNISFSFDRGSIVTQNLKTTCRAGEITSYQIISPNEDSTEIKTESSTEQVNTYEVQNIEITALPLGNSEITIRVFYGEGPQPYMSDGITKYGTPLPAGYIENKFTVTGLTNTWTGTSPEDVNEVDNIHFYEENGAITDPTAPPYIMQDSERIAIEGIFQDLEEGKITGTGFQIALPEVTEPGQIPTALIQTSVNVTGFKVWDEINNIWEWYSINPGTDVPTKEDSISAFTKSDTIYTKTINHQEIQYYAYTYNGSAAGELYFRFYID